jgi:hypothetical protein
MGSWFTTAEMPAIYIFSQSLTPFFLSFCEKSGPGGQPGHRGKRRKVFGGVDRIDLR